VITNNEDLYELIDNLSCRLRDAGETGWSDALKNALSISTVPGEILGETRLQLQKLRKTNLPNQLNLASQINDGVSYIDHILNS
jgi:hypothetical protein